MGNPETLVTLATQGTGQRLEKTQGQIKNGHSRDTGNNVTSVSVLPILDLPFGFL
jgi:hypothetical protein